jgi:hypothetical protein
MLNAKGNILLLDSIAAFRNFVEEIIFVFCNDKQTMKESNDL